LLADERRLFLVACTRARRRLLVTAVDSTGDDESVPSRFLEGPAGGGPGAPDGGAAACGADAVPADAAIPEPEAGGRRVLAPGPLVGELRAVVTADTGDDPAARERRRRAARYLARLARAGIPGAHPRDWYGLAPVTSGTALRGEDDGPVALSPSNVE